MTTAQLEQLKEILNEFPDGSKNLSAVFESASKHIPTYLKVVKIHLEQLERVLQLETHNNRSIANIGLAKPVTQLMQLFKELEDEDINTLENLSIEAANWKNTSNSSIVVTAPTTNIDDEIATTAA